MEDWCARNALGVEVCRVLQDDGFENVDELTMLRDDVIKEQYQIPKRLNLKQCLALQKALKQLTSKSFPETAGKGNRFYFYLFILFFFF
jgi:hypothetical protein